MICRTRTQTHRDQEMEPASRYTYRRTRSALAESVPCAPSKETDDGHTADGGAWEHRAPHVWALCSVRPRALFRGRGDRHTWQSSRPSQDSGAWWKHRDRDRPLQPCRACGRAGHPMRKGSSGHVPGEPPHVGWSRARARVHMGGTAAPGGRQRARGRTHL